MRLILLSGVINLVGCSTVPVSECRVDKNLVHEITFCPRPAEPTNADLASCLRDLRIEIEEDNIRKQELLLQLLVCDPDKKWFNILN